MKLSTTARAFVSLVVVLGLCVLAGAAFNTGSIQLARLFVFVVLACVAAKLNVKLPGLAGTMSVNLPFILIAVADLGLMEALIVGGLSSLTQCLPAANKKFNPVKAAFNVCTMMLAVGAAQWLYVLPRLNATVKSHPLVLGIAAAAYFVVNTIPVAVAIRLTESGRNLFHTWLEMCQLSFPYYLASAGVAGLAITLPVRVDWQIAVAMLPVMVPVFYSYRRYFSNASQAFIDGLRKPVQSQPLMSADSAKAGA